MGLLQFNEVLSFLMMLDILSATVKNWLLKELAIDC
jgi:phage-related holin